MSNSNNGYHTLPQETESKETESRGSTIADASFNFISSLVGAGVIGFGGAIATSGGLISLVCIVFFAVLSKEALDMVVKLAAETEGAGGSYEDLGSVAYGKTGRQIIMISKGLFAFGCLVAFVRITKDNLASALHHVLFGDVTETPPINAIEALVLQENLTTMIACTLVMLPLSFLRDVTPLAKFSGVKVIAFTFIVIITIYLMIVNFNKEDYLNGNFSEHWLTVRGGVIENLGTFIFAFVAQHTVHLVFLSLKPELRNVHSWKSVSTISIGAATAIMIGMGFAVYMTFWEDTKSSMFELYKPSPAVDLARILLSISSLLTFPMCLISTREMVILSLPRSCDDCKNGGEETVLISHQKTIPKTPSWLLPGTDTQLIRPYHILLTVFLFVFSSYLALAAHSLVDVLNLVGCATGTVIGYILPSLFWFKLRGYAPFPMFILIVGGATGVLGTIVVLKAMILGPGDN